MSGIKKSKEELASKERSYSLLTGKKKILIKSMNMFVRLGVDLK